MTTQPEPVHHLLDRLLRGVILPEEAEQLARLVRELEADMVTLRGAHGAVTGQCRAAEAQVRELTARQHPDSRTMCACGRPDPGPCRPCPFETVSLHCACVCEPTERAATA